MPVLMCQNACCEEFLCGQHVPCECEHPVVRSEWHLSMYEAMARYQIHYGLQPVGRHRRFANRLLARVSRVCQRCEGNGVLDWPAAGSWRLCPECYGFGRFPEPGSVEIIAVHTRVARWFPRRVVPLSVDPYGDLRRVLGAGVVYSHEGARGWE